MRARYGMAAWWLLVAVALGQSPYSPPVDGAAQAYPQAPPTQPSAYAPSQQPAYSGAVVAAGPQGAGGAMPAGMQPNMPTLEPRVGPPQRPPAPPFILSAAEQQEVDRMLALWEQHNSSIKRFESNFTRFEYNTFSLGGPQADPNRPAHIDQGKIMYEAPEKGLFKVVGERVNDRVIEGQRAEQWITDGRSIYEFDYAKKELIEHRLPPELQGKSMDEGPMPFLFGAKAENLKRKYFIRLVTPQGVEGQVWLEAWPAFAGADFQRAELILSMPDMMPYAVQLHYPNRDRTVYQFADVKVNSTRLLEFLGGDPFRAVAPMGWKRIVRDEAMPQMTSQPVPERR